MKHTNLDNTMTTVMTVIFAIFVIASIFLSFSGSEFETALEQEQHYCDMVRSGAWPDYRGTFDEVCDD